MKYTKQIIFMAFVPLITFLICLLFFLFISSFAKTQQMQVNAASTNEQLLHNEKIQTPNPKHNAGDSNPVLVEQINLAQYLHGNLKFISEPYTFLKETSDKKSDLLHAEKEEPEASQSFTWNGSRLTAGSGVNYGPSGKETYYNLDMTGVIYMMRCLGNTDEYWVRSDGCKMLGSYIMIAANLSVHPRGSLVQTSLGTGIVCDTGSFAEEDPNQIDIAVTW
ncbi:hypothetical protein [Frisingicoccus sp.]|uniref:hypothetical protein n=1 Tax=Frisingicoccus sp. TaxID=1918627 RepID=UPI00260B6590|nr:hypothetical protein [Frisingicoccus sp.]MDD6232698.1 hypothetical protein [Frisingicoccus sp.]MDY4835365.1 hypothetical protein [Frisingicoccus sp.]MDY4922829.1 hypothetical protein [Frisingicoccus sp.]